MHWWLNAATPRGEAIYFWGRSLFVEHFFPLSLLLRVVGSKGRKKKRKERDGGGRGEREKEKRKKKKKKQSK